MKYLLPIALLTFSIFSIYSQDTIPSVRKGLSNTTRHIYKTSEIKGLNIANKHGNVSVLNWQKDSISITCCIFLEIFNEELATEIFNNVKISNYTSGENVFYKTNYLEEFHCNWPFSIDYTILAPQYITINIKNEIGDITLDSINGKANVSLSYGKLTSPLLLDAKLNLNFSKAQLGTCATLEAHIAHSELDITSSDSTNIQSEYSKVHIVQNKTLDIHSNIDQINISSTNNMNLNGKNSFIVIDTLHDSGTLKLNKGFLKINTIDKRFKELTVDNVEAPFWGSFEKGCGYILHGEITNGTISHIDSTSLNIFHENDKQSISGTIGTPCDPNTHVILFNSDAPIDIK